MPIELSNQLSELITPFIVALLMLVVSLWFKDFATKIAKGLAFSLNKSFQEGDKVILDGERALIVKVGLTQTVFGITKSTSLSGLVSVNMFIYLCLIVLYLCLVYYRCIIKHNLF